MSATYLELKTGTANIFGRADGATADTVRDDNINSAIRFDIANVYPFSWLRKSTTLNLDTSGQADLPADYNYTHNLFDAYDSNITHYYEVNQNTYQEVSTPVPKLYIDYNSSTNRWRVNASTVSKTITVIYYYIPATLSADADVCPVPDPMAVIYLAAAHVWIGFYFDETNHDRFQQLGERRVKQMINMDKRGQPHRAKRGPAYTVDQGFNSLN
jgi:hypothetical protein